MVCEKHAVANRLGSLEWGSEVRNEGDDYNVGFVLVSMQTMEKVQWNTWPMQVLQDSAAHEITNFVR